MFYVYSPHGRIFSGPLERLPKVKPTARARSPEAFRQSPSDYEARAQVEPQYDVSKQAIADYQQLLEGNSAREVVYHAYQIMSSPVVSIQSNATLNKAYEMFQSYSYQLLPVLDERKQLVAALSRRNLYESMLSQARESSVKNDSIMNIFSGNSQEVISSDPVTDIRRIAQVLMTQRMDALPIVEESHRLVGIVSRTDIIRCVTNDPPLSLWA